MKNVAANARFWIAGRGAGILGVARARGFGPSLDGPEGIWITVAGQLLACGGLLIICLGVRRRIKQADSEGASNNP